MTVVEGWFAGTSYKGKVPDMLDLPEAVRPHLELNIAMNSKVTHLYFYFPETCHRVVHINNEQTKHFRCWALCSCPIQSQSVATLCMRDVVSHALGY